MGILHQARLLREGSDTVVGLALDDDDPQADPAEVESALNAARKPELVDDGTGKPEPESNAEGPLDPATTGHQQPSEQNRDAVVALGLRELLADLSGFTFETLSLGQWNADCDQYLSNGDAACNTIFLFDRDFGRENASSDEGLNLVKEAQLRGAKFCGLITHTVQVGEEYDAWDCLSRDHDLDRDRFLVISKQLLSADDGQTDYNSFLRMVRLVALSGKCGDLKNAAWTVFAAAVEAAKRAMESFSVLAFDRIVLASSRREGVWEPDTLFRVFSVFMRREARRLMHEDETEDLSSKVENARSVSEVPVELESERGSEPPCPEAIRVHRFELYESPELLNRHHLPIDLGDIFEDRRGRQYVLLSQPCDLMVRSNGKRGHDGKCRRHVVLAEIVRTAGKDRKAGQKEAWEKVDWYDEETGQPAFVNFAEAHDVRLAVLDLCALNTNGEASINVSGKVPSGLIAPWQKHYRKIQELFRTATVKFSRLNEMQVNDDIKKELLPTACLTANFGVEVAGDVVKYDIKRVGRLLQPRAGAILTRFAQHRSRAAFEHVLDDRALQTSTDDGGGAAEGKTDR